MKQNNNRLPTGTGEKVSSIMMPGTGLASCDLISHLTISNMDITGEFGDMHPSAVSRHLKKILKSIRY
jgi:hypothetical protein